MTHDEQFKEKITVLYPEAGNKYGVGEQWRTLPDGTRQKRTAELYLNGFGSREKPGWYSKDFSEWENVTE